MGKRTAVQATKPVSKKVKTDPVLESVADVINEAGHLPQPCRAMLVDLLPLSLNVTADKRHELQTMVVGMVEETLNTKKSDMEAAVATENLKLGNLKASEGELLSAVKDSEAVLAAQQQVVQTLKVALAEATTTANASTSALAERSTAQKAGDEKMAEAKKEKADLELAFETHYKAPMAEGNAGPHFKELEPFLKTMDIEASLLVALPSSCAKSKEHRGACDDVVLQEVDKAINSKIALLGSFLESEVAAALEREAAVQAAAKEDEASKKTQMQAAADFEAANKELGEREAKLSKAKLAVEEFQPQLNILTEAVDKVKTAFSEFEAGPLANFMTCKTKTDMLAEAAPAGA
jgi:hypothetical protein